jgi:hypothetical protein
MEKTKQELIEMCEKEINRATIFIAYYKALEAKQEKKEAAQTALKRLPLEDSMKINKDMLEFFKAY